MRKTCVLILALACLVSLPLLAQDTLRVLPGCGNPESDSNSVFIELVNSQPVLAIQFDVKDSLNFLGLCGCRVTDRMPNFTIDVNDLDTLIRVVAFDFLGTPLPAGRGCIIELFYDVADTADVPELALKLVNPVVSGMDAQPLQFELEDAIFTIPNPVPVELSHFSATRVAGGVHLTWKTLSETNNFGFEVQRRDADSDYQKIALLNGHGTTQQPNAYEYFDEIQPVDDLWYRLKQIDRDGGFSISEERLVTPSQPSRFALLNSYPNPVSLSDSKRHIRLAFETSSRSTVRIFVFNILGQRVKTLRNSEINSGRHFVLWDGLNEAGERVSAGIYFIHMSGVSAIDGRTIHLSGKMVLVP